MEPIKKSQKINACYNCRYWASCGNNVGVCKLEPVPADRAGYVWGIISIYPSSIPANMKEIEMYGETTVRHWLFWKKTSKKIIHVRVPKNEIYYKEYPANHLCEQFINRYTVPLLTKKQVDKKSKLKPLGLPWCGSLMMGQKPPEDY